MLQYLKYINMFSFPKTMNIKELENMKFRYVILHFFTVALLMYLPLMFILSNTSPYDLCLKLNDSKTIMVITEALAEKGLDYKLLQDTGEISQYLADINIALIQSGLYQQVLNFVLLGSFFLILVVNISYMFIVSLAYNYTRNLFSTIKYRDIVKITVFSSTFPAILCLFISIFVGVLNLFIFQVIECFWVLLFLKSFDNKEKEEVAEIN